MISALRKFTSTSQTFWGCDENDVGGVLGVRIDGETDFTGDTLAAATDYTGTVTATNLTPGEHTYQMLLDGSPVGSEYTFNTGPASGDSFSVLLIGDTATDVAEALNAIRNRESDARFVIGAEMFYLDDGSYGGSADTADGHAKDLTANFPASKTSYQADIRSQYRTALTSGAEGTARSAFINKYPVINSPGNHDLYISDPYGGPGTCLYDAAHDAIFEYQNNGNFEPDGTVDSEPDPVIYTNFSAGDVDFIITDGLTYSAPFATGYLDATSGSASSGDDAQVAWLKARVTASTANVIVINHSTVCRSSEWTSDLFTWLESNATDKTVIITTPDTHVAYVIYREGSMTTLPVVECGYSPSAGVTSSKTFYLPAGDTPYFADNLNEKTTITVETLAADTSLTVADTTPFTTKGSVMIGNNVAQKAISTIPNQTTINFDGTTVGDVYPVGTEVHTVDWPNSTDIANDTREKRRANYGKLIRRPDGNFEDSNAHTEYQLIETFTGAIKFRFRIRDGERQPRFYTSYGKPFGGL